MGSDPATQKEDAIQYVPTDSTLRAVLSHEYVSAHIYTENNSKNGVKKTLREKKLFQDLLEMAQYTKKEFLDTNEQICHYHNDFSIVNPFGKRHANIKYQLFILF